MDNQVIGNKKIVATAKLSSISVAAEEFDFQDQRDMAEEADRWKGQLAR
jgi:hypothetical protein